VETNIEKEWRSNVEAIKKELGERKALEANFKKKIDYLQYVVKFKTKKQVLELIKKQHK